MGRQIVLIPHHIILKTVSGENTAQIHLIVADDAFREHGISVMEAFRRASSRSAPDAWASVDDAQVTGILTLHFDVSDRRPSRVFVLESPVKRGTYRLWFSMWGGDNVDGILCSYDLTVSPSRLPQLRARAPRSAMRAFHGRYTYSGHTMTLHDPEHGQIILSPGWVAGGGAVHLPGAGHWVDVSPYLGALTYSTNNSVVIKYYK